MVATRNRTAGKRPEQADRLDQSDLRANVAAILSRRPTVGLAVGVVRGGRMVTQASGLSDVNLHAPVTQDTAFRIASLTKTFTAIAVMQLWEQGLVDLDAPANGYLHTFKLIPARSSFRPATIRQLLTHTAGIPEVIHLADLAHPDWGPFESRPAVLSVRPGESLPALAEYYQGGPRVVVEPGTAFAYTNHGFATLGQIVEDVSGEPLDRYFREHIFDPLGMLATDLARSGSFQRRPATGYTIGPRGAVEVADREWITRGASSVYSTIRDMTRYLAALAGGGANESGSVLSPATLEMMFEPQYQPDPRLPGMGLGFFRDDVGGHLVVGHDGRLPGFNAQLLVAPRHGVGIVGLTNGSSGATSWMPTEFGHWLRELLGVPEPVARPALPQHPEVWSELCGQYRLPERISDLRGRLLMAGGVEVSARGGQLTARLRSPVPALSARFPLLPDDPEDRYLFRLDLSRFGMPRVRVAFSREGGPGIAAAHTDLTMLSLWKQPPGRTRWRRVALAGALISATALVGRRVRAGSE